MAHCVICDKLIPGDRLKIDPVTLKSRHCDECEEAIKDASHNYDPYIETEASEVLLCNTSSIEDRYVPLD